MDAAMDAGTENERCNYITDADINTAMSSDMNDARNAAMNARMKGKGTLQWTLQ
jgi:hypothetical protein